MCEVRFTICDLRFAIYGAWTVRQEVVDKFAAKGRLLKNVVWRTVDGGLVPLCAQTSIFNNQQLKIIDYQHVKK